MPISIKSAMMNVALVATSLLLVTPSEAETMAGALAKAYQHNASLNSARADVRITNEDVPIARSGYRPQIVAQGGFDLQRQSGVTSRSGFFGVQIQQSIFDGFQTLNNVEAAEAQVRAANEGLRNTEQNILFNASDAYVSVIRDRRIARFREEDLEFLSEQVRAAEARLDVGEGTRTDVAQAQAQRAAAVAQLSAARAQANASAAVYRQVIGEDPGTLQAASPPTNLIPGSIEQAFALALAEHPAIIATQHLVDAAAFAVNATEGAMLPQLSAQAGVSTSRTSVSGAGAGDPDLPGVGTGGTTNSASVGIDLTIPIYQGGRVSAQVRQSKEVLEQARIEIEVARDEVRQATASAFVQYIAAGESMDANRQLVSAAQLALEGVMEERDVGQRTTLDVLNAQADVIAAQINLVNAERDSVLAGFGIALSTGRLSARQLGLNVVVHRPEEHYNAVRDRWYGTTTPDGR